MTTGTPVVTFDYTGWSVRYPELAQYVAQPQAQAFFNEATLYCDNSTSSPVSDPNKLAMLLNMLTAHIAALNTPQVPNSQVVGRINSASQGSVSVQTELQYAPGSVQWFAQTQYGIAYWEAAKIYRMFRYGAAYRRNQDPYSPYRR